MYSDGVRQIEMIERVCDDKMLISMKLLIIKIRIYAITRN